jgi:hypothetical protein
VAAPAEPAAVDDAFSPAAAPAPRNDDVFSPPPRKRPPETEAPAMASAPELAPVEAPAPEPALDAAEPGLDASPSDAAPLATAADFLEAAAAAQSGAPLPDSGLELASEPFAPAPAADFIPVAAQVAGEVTFDSPGIDLPPDDGGMQLQTGTSMAEMAADPSQFAAPTPAVPAPTAEALELESAPPPAALEPERAPEPLADAAPPRADEAAPPAESAEAPAEPVPDPFEAALAASPLFQIPEPAADVEVPQEPEPEYRPAPGMLHVEELLGRAVDREKIADALLWFCEGRFTSALLFTVRGDIAEGWRFFGDKLSASEVRRVIVPLRQPSLLAAVRQHGKPLVREKVLHGIDRRLVAFAGLHPASHVAAAPISVKGEVVNLLWASRGSWPLRENIADELDRAADRASRAYERLLLSHKSFSRR